MGIKDNSLLVELSHCGNGIVEEYHIAGIVRCQKFHRPTSAYQDSLGDYRWTLHDEQKDEIIASEGFSPLFGEWQMTLNGNDNTNTICLPEVLVIPECDFPVLLRIEKRNNSGEFVNVFELNLVDSLNNADFSIQDFEKLADARISKLLHNGPASDKLDILIVSEGYTNDESTNFLDDAHRVCATLFGVKPFSKRVEDFNVNTVFFPSGKSGVPLRPAKDSGSNFETSYGILDMSRYLVPHNLHFLWRVSAHIEWDTMIVLCNSDDYGGSGLFNQFCCIPAKARDFEYLLIHEIGHSLAGLGDEYFSSSITYSAERLELVSPWEANISSMSPDGLVKWNNYLSAGVPVPTPWNKSEFLKLDKLRARNTEHEENSEKAQFGKVGSLDAQIDLLFQSNPHYTKVGAYEGARYQEFGLFRPEIDCRMFSRTAKRFCVICEQAIHSTIDKYCGVLQTHKMN